MTHMKLLEGCASLLQLSGLLARMSKMTMDPSLFSGI
jgi:hypothetical protein